TLSMWSGTSSRLGTRDSELAHARPDGRSAHPEHPRGAVGPGQHAAALLERALNVLALHLLERQKAIGRGASPGHDGDVVFRDDPLLGDDDRAPERVGQRPEWAGPAG